MNIRSVLLVGPIALALPAASLAQGEPHHPGSDTAAQVAPEPGQAKTPQEAGAAKTPAMMPLQEARQKMREQIQAIRSTRDPEERRRLLAEHMRAMQDMMQMMQGMREAETTIAAAPGMGGGGMMGMMHGGRGMGMLGNMMQRHMAMEQRVAALEKRLDAMQTLVDELLQHEEAQTEQP